MSIILCSGFDPSLYPSICTETGGDTIIVTLKKNYLSLTLAELVANTEALSARAAEAAESVENNLLDGQRYVIFSGSRDALDTAMKSFKKIYRPAAGTVIYAMLTDTARGWTLQKYLTDLLQEHHEMRQYFANKLARQSEAPS